ncbi:hypothetical protein GCM10020000_09100 [Streptomyces olivoverticillatus]
MGPDSNDHAKCPGQRAFFCSSLVTDISQLFLELRHKVEIHRMAGWVVECPIDEMNRPPGSKDAALRIPPTEPGGQALFTAGAASWRPAASDVNTRDVNYKRYRDECLREGLDPDVAVEVEALTPGLLRSRLNDAIEALVNDVRKWNIEARTEEAERELLRSLHGTVKKIVRRTTGEPSAEDEENR